MPTTILAIETSLDACSVAIASDEIIKASFTYAPRQQTQLLLPMIEQLLLETKLKISDVDALAFSYGPASFTGLRISSSVIQALAFAANKPVVLVSTLQTLAQGSWREHQTPQVVVAVDAFMQEIYWGAYELGADHVMTAKTLDQLDKPDALTLGYQDKWTAVGNAWTTYENILLTNVISKPTAIDVERSPHAYDVAQIAIGKFAQGEVVCAEAALPHYLRGADAWKKTK